MLSEHVHGPGLLAIALNFTLVSALEFHFSTHSGPHTVTTGRVLRTRPLAHKRQGMAGVECLAVAFVSIKGWFSRTIKLSRVISGLVSLDDAT